MNYKSVLVSALSVIIALVIWEMFIKKMVIRNEYEAFDYLPDENEGYLRQIA